MNFALRPGQTTPVTLVLDRRAFSYYDVIRHDWTAAPDEFVILVGSSSADIRLQGEYSLAPGWDRSRTGGPLTLS